jgi:hypothetical protein
VSETLARWGAFLGKIRTRFGEIQAESDAGFEGLVGEDSPDPQTFSGAMSAIDLRVKELDQKIGDTFSEQVFPKLEGADIERGIEMGEVAHRELRESFARWSSAWNIRLYEKLRPLAEAAYHRGVHCPSCGAPAHAPVAHKMGTFPCGACRAAIQYFPDPLVSQYFLGAPHVYGEAANLEQRLGIERMRREAGERVRKGVWRPEPFASLRAWEDAERACWRTYFEAKFTMEGTPFDQIESWIESRMRWFYEARQMEREWVENGGRRVS